MSSSRTQNTLIFFSGTILLLTAIVFVLLYPTVRFYDPNNATLVTISFFLSFVLFGAGLYSRGNEKHFKLIMILFFLAASPIVWFYTRDAILFFGDALVDIAQGKLKWE